ncbi:STAS domain-containing protein [Thiocystis violacea]|uniref:STAS domain-containing protein n=1 Tax=Thiocystis violacea TaxID=13725 RepID=UPI00190488B3|nr:STAS domain-containing protein [Thiocystis violacea]MBK1721822.1 hypothetical protein [Thiocystis violacea]
MTEGRARYARRDGTWLIKLEGDVRHPLSRGLNALLDQIFADAELRRVLVDLSETETIDSTNLGVLARIANHMVKQGRSRPTLIAPDPDIQTILRSVCFDRIFHILSHSPPSAGDLDDLPDLAPDERATLTLMLGAHRRLSALDAGNELQFRDLIHLLEQEYRRGG